MTKTYRSVFPTVALHPVGGESDTQRRSSSPPRGPAEAERAPGNWGGLRAHRRRRSTCARRSASLGAPVPFDDVPMLTDGYAPTDSLLIG